MANKLKLTRDQLASFLKDAEQIKPFEQLFTLADSIAPDVVNHRFFTSPRAKMLATKFSTSVEQISQYP